MSVAAARDSLARAFLATFEGDTVRLLPLLVDESKCRDDAARGRRVASSGGDAHARHALRLAARCGDAVGAEHALGRLACVDFEHLRAFVRMGPRD